MSRSAALIFATGVLVIALLPRCANTCGDGVPCSESQAGVVCEASGCEAFECDGVQFGRLTRGPGDACDQPGATCPVPSGGSGACDSSTMVCNASHVFEVQETVGPGMPCSGTLCCKFPGDECGACRCEDGHFVCTPGICTPSQPCPSEDTLVSGAACGPTPFGCGEEQPPTTCMSSAWQYPCGASCHCYSGAWQCAPLTCAGDAGADAAD